MPGRTGTLLGRSVIAAEFTRWISACDVGFCAPLSEVFFWAAASVGAVFLIVVACLQMVGIETRSHPGFSLGLQSRVMEF